ncbi:Cell division control protein 25 [Nakaseomyces bracarensis]|uniref:Cell division control protein 25 n=1 Tax=Nakaseomyces bracarensis TaxID=273131 RepID=UPI003872A667
MLKTNETNGFKPMDVVRAIADYMDHVNEKDQNKLTFYHGDVIYVVNKLDSGWWDGIVIQDNLVSTGNNKQQNVLRGWFPGSYTRSLVMSSKKCSNTNSVMSSEVNTEFSAFDINTLTDTEKLRTSITSMLTSAPKVVKLEQQPENYDETVLLNYVQADRHLFYLSDSDIITWTQLYLVLRHFSNKCREYFLSSYKDISNTRDKKTHRPAFRYNFKILSAYITYLIVACRILEHSTPNDTIIPGNKEKILYLVENKLIGSLSLLAEHVHIWYNHLYYIHYKHNDADTVIRGENISTLKKSGIITKSYHLVLKGFDDMNDSLRDIFELLKTYSINHKTVLIPQLFPRFFKSSFNGGAWSNPFAISPALENNLRSETAKSQDTIAEIVRRVHDYHRIKKYNVSSQRQSESTSDSRNSSISAVSGQNPKGLVNGYAPSSIFRPPTRRTTSCCNHSIHGVKNTSISNASHFTIFKDKSRSYDLGRIVKYPLTKDTLELLEKRKGQIHVSFSESSDSENNDGKGSVGSATSADKNAKPKAIQNLEANFKTYKEINTTFLILSILENLDLSLFTKMNQIVRENNVCGTQFEIYKDLLSHTLSSVAIAVDEFFRIKQIFHDNAIRLIMCSQHTTLDDPYVFASMSPNYAVGTLDSSSLGNLTLRSKSIVSAYGTYLLDNEKELADNLYKKLISEDAEFNYVTYFSVSSDFKDARRKYQEMAEAATIVVAKLIKEREDILNYAARTMQSELVAKLLEDEEINDYLNEEEELSQDDSDIIISPETDDMLIPWFLQPNYTDEVVFDSKGRLKSANKHDILEYLFQSKGLDKEFMTTLLLSFATIYSPSEFIHKVIEKYEESPPENLSYEEYNIWIEKKYLPNKEKAIFILWNLFKFFWNKSYYNFSFELLERCTKAGIREKIVYAKELQSLIHNIKSNNKNAHFTSWSLSQPTYSSRPKFPNHTTLSRLNFVEEFSMFFPNNISDISAAKLSRQLTAIEEELFNEITIFDCLYRVWGDKFYNSDADNNISKFVAFANNLTKFVTYKVLSYDSPKERASIITYFIKVTDECYLLKNFSSMTALISGLYASPLYRLKNTWKYVQPEYCSKLQNLNDFMDSAKNFHKYRETLRNIKGEPCIPFFGVYLSDLIFTHNGNKDYINKNNSIVNFTKRFRIFDIIQEIFNYKHYNYNFRVDKMIRTYINAAVSDLPSIEEQYQISLKLEPRSGKNNSDLDSPLGDKVGNTELKGIFPEESQKKKSRRHHLFRSRRSRSNETKLTSGSEKNRKSHSKARKRSSGFKLFSSKPAKLIDSESSLQDTKLASY